MMDLDSIRAAYGRYHRIYDVFFGSVMNHGRKLAVEIAAREPGARVLEVGVGTGISLPLYPRHTRITGIDVSPEMLDKARRRVAQHRLGHVEALVEGDGERLDFADASFDASVAMYVVSVAPDPMRLMEEMRRVTKPGGDILVLNHFMSRNPLLRSMEKSLRPFSSKMGFRPDLEAEDILSLSGVEVVAIRRTNPFGYWKLLHFRNGEDQAVPAAGSRAAAG